jgi:hypothetical protein
LVSRSKRSRLSCGVASQLGASYTAVFHQFGTRRDNLVAALAPLVVVDLVLLALLAVPVPLAAFAAGFGLVINTARAAGDLYFAARILRLPAVSLLFDDAVRYTSVPRPVDA